ncbi:septation protein SepH [Spelaeicoccus albus]|uniref:DUF3071 domain-containing protein n=1 Tax=Spelaeicoccus albus TaxID=1280376 RepID=A0A7Z0D3F4_9MICO|nr:septation protein SepH [Spelaeicoccus albus]NYI68157.1 hypothetical protein [Spelaeicoccus albus]
MQDLKLLGVHDDEEHLVLAGPEGERYLLPVDEALYAAVRRDRAHLGQLQAGQDPARPRDIQAKIRAGLTAEEVAEGAGVPLEQVRRYEGPVLAERSHIAELAGRVLVYSSQDPAADGRPLADLASERLRLRDVDLETAGWDAWRRPDSRWYVELTFTAGGKKRTASWTFDRGSLTPEDDEARWLTDSGPVDSGPLPPRRLTAVSDNGSREDAPDETTAPSTDHLLDTLGARRGRRTPVDPHVDDSDPYGGLLDEDSDAPASGAGTAHLAAAVDPDDGPDDRNDASTAPGVWPLGAHTAASAPEEADSPEVLAVPDRPERDKPAGKAFGKSAKKARKSKDAGKSPEPADSSAPAGATGQDDQLPGQQSLLDDENFTPPAAKRGKRHSVPSWDEIMFGAKRD